jgi:hypothetical protein
MEYLGIGTHLSVRNPAHVVEIEGKSLLLFYCPLCGREFARDDEQADWRAAYVGPFRVTFLAESVSQQWLSEPCPGTLPIALVDSSQQQPAGGDSLEDSDAQQQPRRRGRPKNRIVPLVRSAIANENFNFGSFAGVLNPTLRSDIPGNRTVLL